MWVDIIENGGKKCGIETRKKNRKENKNNMRKAEVQYPKNEMTGTLIVQIL